MEELPQTAEQAVRRPAGGSEKTDAPPRIVMPATVQLPRMVKAPLPEQLDELAAAIYRMLDRTPKHLEELVDQSDVPVNQVLRALTRLEMAGVAEASAGRRYAARFVQEQLEPPRQVRPEESGDGKESL